MDEEYEEEFYIKLSFSLSIIKYVERKWSLIEGRIRNICETKHKQTKWNIQYSRI